MELYDVFISYRRSDGSQYAEELYTYLTNRGLSVFLDREKLKKSGQFPLGLERALKMAPNYVLIGTDDVFRFDRNDEDWVRWEIRLALERNDSNPDDGAMMVLTPKDARIPSKSKMPEDVSGIATVQRILMDQNEESAFAEVFAEITQVNRGNLWAGARRWLQESRAPGGRFARLDICQTILPNARQEHHAHMPVYVHGEDSGNRDLLSAIGESRGHVYLIGEGGIGKTTALMHIMDDAYGKELCDTDQVPIFVELSFAPDTYGSLYATQVASFIRRSVYRQIRRDLRIKQISMSAVDELDEIFTIAPDVAVRPVNDLFSLRTDAPEYLLLLDGLNEVSQVVLENGRSVQEMVVGEIDYLMRCCPNVRVILTSRTDAGLGGENVAKLHLSGVDSAVARDYLLGRGLEKARVDEAFENDDLAKTLAIPLFLTMYAALSQEADALTQGEILRLFFHERSRNLELYTAQDRLTQTDENLHNAASEQQHNRPDGEVLRFVLDFVLPELGWYMERRGLFYLSAIEVTRVLKPLLTGTDETDFCGPHGKTAFEKYRKAGSARSHVQTVAKRLCTVMGEGDRTDFDLICENLLTCCVGMLGILHENRAKFGFVHQHIRDYFAAVRNTNTLRLALHIWEQGEGNIAAAVLGVALKEDPLGMTVRRFLGESLGEHRNRPVVTRGQAAYAVPEEPCDRNVIDRVLNIYRGRFGGEDGYGLYSLLKILAEVRGALAGCDLSALDLKGCHLNGTHMGMPGLAAKVEGSRFGGEELFFSGHTNSIRFMDFSADGAWLLSAPRDGKVCIWDAKTGIQRCNIVVENLMFAGFTARRDRFLTVCTLDFDNNIVCTWDVGGLQLKREVLALHFDKHVRSQDRKHLLVWDSTHHSVLDTESLETLMTKSWDNGLKLQEAAFAGDGRLVLHFSFADSERTRTEIRPMEGNGEIQVLDALADCNVSRMACFSRTLWAMVVTSNVDIDIVELRAVDILDGSSTVVYRKALNSEYLYDKKILCSDGGRWIAVQIGDTLEVYEIAGWHPPEIHHEQLGGLVEAAAFHDGSERMALGTSNGNIRVFDTREFLPVMAQNGASTKVEAFELSPDGQYLMVRCRDSMSLWDMAKCCQLACEKTEGQQEYSFSKDCRLLAIRTPYHSRVVTLPDMETAFECDNFGEFSRCGRYFVEQKDGIPTVYDVADFHPVRSFTDGEICGFVDDRVLVAYKYEGIFRWLRSVRRLVVEELYTGRVCGLLDLEADEEILSKYISVGGDRVAVGTEDGFVRIFDGHNLRKICGFREDMPERILLPFSWDKNTPPRKAGLSSLDSLELSSDGKYLALNTFDTRIVRYLGEDEAVTDVKKLDGSVSIKGNLVVNTRGGKFAVCTMEGKRIWSKELECSLRYAMDREGRLLVLKEKDDTLGVYLVAPELEEVIHLWEINMEHGLDVLGVDMRNMHPDVRFTPEQARKLKLYGAILPGE